MKILIIGKGYLGTRCAESWGDEVILSDKIVKTVEDVEALLAEHQPEAVLNAAGIVGKPNVDWCETHQLETIEGNTILPITIAQACQNKNVYLLHMGTGCIFYGSSPHGGPWTEDDYGNPVAVYTRAKYAADLILATLPNVGIARIRMPIDYKSHPANLIDKLARYPKIVDVENSVTIVEDMIAVFHQLLEKKATGIFHVTNPGSIKHQEIIELYEKYVDASHHNEWISEEDLVKIGLADKKRSNNIMTSKNLAKYGITMRPILEALEDTMKKYKK
ncbi:NAD-dependent epimerase/dehydratase family protein [Candidatus Parcubacteria bacterium]|nr:MAG: NAD-dependent epimerase/dehydratase family protein [Candidatus Parcubacteria bacterium]